MLRRLALTLALLTAAPAAAIPPIMPDGPPPVPPNTNLPPPWMTSPRMERPVGDLLGQVWEQDEVAGWRAVWIRRGRSNIFDAYWQHPSGERVLAVIEITLRGRQVIVVRRHAGGQYCRYDGALGPGWREVSGRYTCTWERTPMAWRARIVHLDEVTPHILRR